ncbi:DUF6629 family protein [Marinobacter fonticola]|uniref:DUF6629 family protein n=1 Tax=Marinobacter fonticola TaxID=2603215 RepID=UPI0011E883B8|nr:DUF6629 family protein [Marinobacter fonticola]
MCFSATASFASGATVAIVGVATLARTRHHNEWLFAAIPFLFAIHQTIEGMVWLGLHDRLGAGSLGGWGFLYMLYAQALLPLLMPLSVWLIEPDMLRRRRILPFLMLGVGLCAYTLWALINFETAIEVRGHSVAYSNSGTGSRLVAALYIAATCGAVLFSGYRYIVAFGVLNLLGMITVLIFKQYAFTSIWCAYAAIISVLIYVHFHRRRRAEAQGAVLEH